MGTIDRSNLLKHMRPFLTNTIQLLHHWPPGLINVHWSLVGSTACRKVDRRSAQAMLFGKHARLVSLFQILVAASYSVSLPAKP